MKCLLCKSDSKSYDTPNNSGNIIVECSECGMYEYTSGAFMYYLNPERESPLEDGDRKKLSEHIKIKYDPEKDIPVLITPNVITSITGKVSMKVNYS